MSAFGECFWYISFCLIIDTGFPSNYKSMDGWMATPNSNHTEMAHSIIYSSSKDIDKLKSLRKRPESCISIQEYDELGKKNQMTTFYADIF